MKLRHIKIEDAITPKDGLYRIVCDYWWIVSNDNTLMYGASLQANSNKTVAEHVRDKVYPTSRVEQIPVVYIPINYKEYNYR